MAERICSVEGCGWVVLARGWCNKHYKRWRRLGDPEALAGHKRPGTPVEARFWERVVEGEGCWEWQGSRDPKNYGVLYSNGERFSAHRLSWTILRGPIPEGLFVCHHCDNPPCVRPDHLFLGTSADNMADMKRKGRAARHGGTRNPRAKLTEEQVAAIRLRASQGEVQRLLAAEFGVSQSTVSGIAVGRIWRSRRGES